MLRPTDRYRSVGMDRDGGIFCFRAVAQGLERPKASAAVKGDAHHGPFTDTRDFLPDSDHYSVGMHGHPKLIREGRRGRMERDRRGKRLAAIIRRGHKEPRLLVGALGIPGNVDPPGSVKGD